MKVYVSTDFEGHWPVGSAAVVVAENESDAATLLSAELLKHGLPAGGTFTLREVPTDKATAVVLCDGNY